MSRRCYGRHGRGAISEAVDDTARIAAKFGPLAATWTGVIGFVVFFFARLALGTSVAKVALELGYGTPRAFTVMFRQQLGASPQQYLSSL